MVGDEVACAECLLVVRVVRETIEGMNRAIAEHNKKVNLDAGVLSANGRDLGEAK